MADTKREEGSFASDMLALMESGDGADVTLVVGDSELAAHSLILAARSPVFAAMLRSDMREALSRRVEITDMQEAVVRQMVLFMYTETVPQQGSMAAELLEAAEKYNLPLLRKRCEEQLARDITVDNAAATAALAVLHRCPGLKTTAVEFVAGHPAVMATTGWTQLLRGNADVAAEICGQLAKLLPPAPLENRILSTDEKQKLGVRLAEAAKRGSVLETRKLLAVGAPPDGRDALGNTALHCAVLNKQVQVVKCLLDAGADVRATDSCLQTPLHTAASIFDQKVMCILIAASAPLDAKDRWGKTPLHWAAESNVQAVKTLLMAGASTDIKNYNGKVPAKVLMQSLVIIMLCTITKGDEKSFYSTCAGLMRAFQNMQKHQAALPTVVHADTSTAEIQTSFATGGWQQQLSASEVATLGELAAVRRTDICQISKFNCQKQW
ncbi:poly [ADP-ribose] polymerase tankyrase-1-like isoform X2 [Schistocerca nitens]|uniref:poly [ADP-ribose] polymerase tankyrase-1-like isoform X2 n=1 Tax=Schistocerca nitens TaxID=7011 RepID=UPI002118E9BF|nr:poly [ADP-ribose] polymerase tankyrase-1-like isoform X2 [Schistocerca nitens]